MTVDYIAIGGNAGAANSANLGAMMTGTVTDLTEGQRACLRLYYRQYSAKEIARELNIAPSTVHQRLTASRKILGVARSMEAARILVDAEGPIYDGVPYDAITVADRHTGWFIEWVSRLPWPFPTRTRPTNDLTLVGKLAAIVGLAALFMIAAAFYFVAIRVLSRNY